MSDDLDDTLRRVAAAIEATPVLNTPAVMPPTNQAVEYHIDTPPSPESSQLPLPRMLAFGTPIQEYRKGNCDGDRDDLSKPVGSARLCGSTGQLFDFPSADEPGPKAKPHATQYPAAMMGFETVDDEEVIEWEMDNEVLDWTFKEPISDVTGRRIGERFGLMRETQVWRGRRIGGQPSTARERPGFTVVEVTDEEEWRRRDEWWQLQAIESAMDEQWCTVTTASGQPDRDEPNSAECDDWLERMLSMEEGTPMHNGHHYPVSWRYLSMRTMLGATGLANPPWAV